MIYGTAYNPILRDWVAFIEETHTILSRHATEEKAMEACKRYERIRCQRIIRNPLRDLSHAAV